MTIGLVRAIHSRLAEQCYVGPERREERRRSVRNDEFEKLLGHFGLNRRVVPNRRSADTSWLLLSETAIDRAVNL